MILLTELEMEGLVVQMVILYNDDSLMYNDIKAFLDIKHVEYIEVPAADSSYVLSVDGTLYNYHAALAWVDKQ